LVERVVWDHEVAGSNPVTPTIFFSDYFALSWRVLLSLRERMEVRAHASVTK
jgi:hypothetical protein